MSTAGPKKSVRLRSNVQTRRAQPNITAKANSLGGQPRRKLNQVINRIRPIDYEVSEPQTLPWLNLK